MNNKQIIPTDRPLRLRSLSVAINIPECTARLPECAAIALIRNARSAPFYIWKRLGSLASCRVFCHFRQSSDKMTAQEQMKKMLDELMGTQRDGECKKCDVKVKIARNVLSEFEDLTRLCVC